MCSSDKKCREVTCSLFCESLLGKAKKVLLNIISIRKSLFCIYFQHTNLHMKFTKLAYANRIMQKSCMQISVLKVDEEEVFPYRDNDL